MKLMEQSAADPSHRRLSVDSQQLLSEGANFVPPRKPTNQFHIDLPSRPAFPKGAVTRIDDPSVETEPELITNIEPRVPLGRKAGTARAAPPFRAGSNKDMDVTGNWGPFLGMGGPDSASLTPLVAGERPANSTGRSKLGAGESATPALGDLNSPSPVAADYYGTGLGSTPALPGGATPGLLGAPDRGNLGQPDERSPGQGSTGDQQLLPPEQDPNFQRTGSVASNVSGAADPMQSGGAAGGSNLNPDWSNGFWLGRGDGADGSGDPNVAMQGVNFNQNMQYQEPGNMAGYGDPYGGQQGGMDLSNPNSMRSGGGGYGNPNSYNNGQYAQQGYGMQMGGNMGYQGGYGNMMGNYGSYQGQGMFSGQQGGYGDFHGQGGYGSQGYNMSGMPMYQQGGQPGNMQSQLDDWQRMGANGNNQQMMQGPGYMSQLDPSLQMQQAEFGAVQLRQGNQPVHLGTLAPDSTVMGVSMQPNQQRIPGMQGGLQTQNPLSPSETAPKKSSGKRQAAVAEEEDEEDEEENGESSESEPEQRSRRRKTKGDSDDDFGSRRKKPKAGSAPMRRTTRQAAQPSAATTPSSVERVRREKAEMVSEAPRQVKVQPAVPRGQQQQFQEQEQMVLHQQAQHVMSAQHLPIQAQQQAALSNQSQIQHMHHFQQQPQHQQIVQMPAHQQMHIQHQGGNRQLAAYAPPGVAMPPAHTTTNENAANVDESLRGLSTNKQQLQTLLQQAHVDPNTGDHFCPVCNKPFKKMVLLKSHLKMHDPTKSFQCPHCDRSFLRAHDRHRHIRSIHLDKKSFVCPSCGAQFARSDALRRHTSRENTPCFGVIAAGRKGVRLERIMAEAVVDAGGGGVSSALSALNPAVAGRWLPDDGIVRSKAPGRPKGRRRRQEWDSEEEDEDEDYEEDDEEQGHGGLDGRSAQQQPTQHQMQQMNQMAAMQMGMPFSAMMPGMGMQGTGLSMAGMGGMQGMQGMQGMPQMHGQLAPGQPDHGGSDVDGVYD